MEENNTQFASGSDRVTPQRGQAAYVPRQAAYYSAAQPAVPNPTLTQAVEAAQRIVLPQTPTAPPAQPAPVKPPVNYAGSFDMLAPQRPSPPQTPQVVPAPQATVPPAPAIALPQPAPAPPSVDFSLPTDLPRPMLAEEPATATTRTHGKLALQLPKLSRPKVLAGVAVLLVVMGGAFVGLGSKTNKQIVAQVKSAHITKQQDTDGGLPVDGTPTEDGNPPSVDYYRTAASYPRVLRIPKIQVETRVLALSILPTGALKAPATIFDAGWYKDSSKPGEDGAMVIDGHESGATKPGVFKNLGKLTKGDKLEIERGDGQTFTYTVKSVNLYDADNLDMSSVMVPAVQGKQGLNIITCAGKFDEATGKYPQRTVVYAVL